MNFINKENDFAFDRSISFKIFLSRSSNSPRYFVPATREPRSSETSSLSFKIQAHRLEPFAMPRPSTIAVFPTPASPIKNRIVFGPTGKNLNDAGNFIVAADNRIEFIFTSKLLSGCGCILPEL
jgi:hypothetical protein